MREVNKGAVVLIIVMLLGAGGYLWHLKLYKPAVAAHTTAVMSAQSAEDALAAAEQKLAAATKAAEDAKDKASKPDDAVARLATARSAVPEQGLLDDAAIVLVEMAQRSGVQTSFKAGGEDAPVDPAAGGALSGAVPIDLEFKAAGTYAEMMQFMSLVEGNVEAKDDKLYTRGRLFNVVKLKIGGEDESGGSADAGFSTDPSAGVGDDKEFNLGPNDIVFSVIVRMYTSTTENSMGVGTNTPDAAAAATDPAAAGADPAAGGVASTGPAAGGGAMNGDPNATSTGTTDPAAAATGVPAETASGGI